MITFKFNEHKTAQVAALFLKKNKGKMNYMKLIKLLYLTDREALNLWERPLTGDTYFSMERGPVLSNVLDIINYPNHDDSYWYKYITEPKDYEIALKDNSPEEDTLSIREIKLIDEIFDKFKDFDQWEMVDICHDILPEWEDVKGTSKLISIEDILKKEHRSPEEIDAIEEEVTNLNFVKTVLAIED